MTSDAEGSPVITKEALSLGTRVVSADVGDMATQLEGMSGCRIVAGGGPAAYVGAIRSVLGEAGPDVAEARRRFDNAREAAGVLEIWNEVLGR
jgi:hypothetical protein